MKKENDSLSPLMRQYDEVKQQHPDAILLFRVGDFYETFAEDAIKTASILGIVLTKRNNGGVDVELAGFPYHSLDMHLPRLVRAGFRVAICEQLEKPSAQKKVIKRGVTEILTPGIATNDKLLDYKSNNFLASLHYGRRDQYGIAFLDISTGEFLVSEGNAAYIEKLFQAFAPSEIIFAKSKKAEFEATFGSKHYTYHIEDWVYTLDYAREQLLIKFEVASLKGYGVDDLTAAQVAAGAVLHYLKSTENTNLQHLNSIARIQPDKHVWLDRFTIRNLELLESPHNGGVPLLKVLDKTASPMGARLLKKWIALPLRSREHIETRLNAVDYFIHHEEVSSELEKLIQQVGDLERLIAKVPLGKITPREALQLHKALDVLQTIKHLLEQTDHAPLQQIGDRLNPCVVLRDQIGKWLVEEPPVNVAKGNVFKEGVSDELDDLRDLIKNSKAYLVGIQQNEAEKTGISSLKIGFNSVFGYYLEVTNKYKDQGRIPQNWVRRQTLANAERYITEELKELETKILGAEERILAIETELFEELVATLSGYIKPIQVNAAAVAQLDCLLSFKKIAVRHNYCRPVINNSLTLQIKGGRHPVIEQQLPLGETYVPNDLQLDNEGEQILIITGPNMSGKSAILRQTALIVLMAQMGSFVPATSADIGLIDKVFTRVGASDNISSGESTFMVEMNETAGILNNISERSLLLLDEIGRGTSTYDGISIAWAIAEYLHNNGYARPKTLFATHYHELAELADKFDRIKNYSVATKNIDNKVIFMRKLVAGGSNHSFGIYVAKMAGMPRAVVERAHAILTQLEQKSIDNQQLKTQLKKMPDHAPLQLNIFETEDPVAKRLKEMLQDIDVNRLTPIECMLKLNSLKEILKKAES